MSTWSLVGDEPAPTPLAAAARDRAEAARLRAALEHRQEAARGALVHVAALEARVGKERGDVERLESASWTRLWVALAGNRAEELEREHADVREAEYALAVAAEQLRAAEAERDAVRARLDGLGDVDAAYARALDARERELKTDRGGPGWRLARIEEELGRLESRRVELDEANRAGVAAFQRLSDAQTLLGSAESWATWDTFGGGGLMTDLVKRDTMDQARRLLEEADVALRAFDRELADVSRAGGVHLDESLARSLGDVWFDNVFSDYRVLTEVRDARARLHQVVEQVRTLGHQLEADLRETDRERGRLREEREALLLGSVRQDPDGDS